MEDHTSDKGSWASLQSRIDALLAKSCGDIATTSPEEIRGMVHELQAHQIELERRVLQLTQELEESKVRLEAEIADRHRATSELLASESQMRSVVDTAVDAIITIDARGTIQSLNGAAARMFGYAASEAIGQNVKMLMPEPHHSRHDGYLRHYLETHEKRIIGNGREVDGRRKDGSTFPIHLSVSEFEVEGGVWFTGIVRDISDRKRFETEFIRQHDRAQQYLEIASVMFVGLNREGVVTLANPKTCEVLGYERDEIVGKDWFAHFLPRRVRNTVRGVFKKLIDGETELVEFFENEVLTKAGEERIIEWHNAEVRDSDGRIVGTLGSGTDITERKRYESDVKRLQKEVVDAASLEQERLGRELHDDAGQRLRGLAFYAGTLATRLADTPQEREATQARELKEGIEEALSKVRAISHGLIASDMSESALLNALGGLARDVESQYGVRCRFSYEQAVPFPNHGVRTQLYRIAQEALSNAVFHGSPTRVDVQLTDTPESITLIVQDDGTGFSNDGPAGQGLGLRVMRHRAEVMGGELTIESEPGKGTTVTCSVGE